MITPWAIVGGAAALAGAVVVAWALWWDRSGGRRRCPKCWYDMSSVPGLACPECGRTARHEGRMYRTRRRRLWAAAGLLLVAAGWAASIVPEFGSGAWVARVPSAALFWAYPWLDRIDPALKKAVEERIDTGMTRWQHAILSRRAVEQLRTAELASDRSQAAWLLRELQSRDRMSRPYWRNRRAPGGFTYDNRPTVVDALGDEGVAALVDAMADVDLSVRTRAMSALYEFGEAARPALPRTLAALASEDPAERELAGMLLMGVAHRPESVRQIVVDEKGAPGAAALAKLAAFDASRAAEALPLLREASLDADWKVRVLALWGLALLSDGSEEDVRVLLDATFEDDARVSGVAIEGLAVRGANASSLRPRLLALLDDADAAARSQAVRGLARLKLLDAEAIARMTQLLRDDPAWSVRWEVLRTLIEETADPVARETAVAVVLDAALDPDETVSNLALAYMGRLNVEPERAVPVLRKVLASDSHNRVRRQAAGMLIEAAPDDPETISCIVGVLADPEENPYFRGNMAEWLARLDPALAAAALPTLEAMASEEGYAGAQARDAIAAIRRGTAGAAPGPGR